MALVAFKGVFGSPGLYSIHADPSLVGLRFCHVFGSLYLLKYVESRCCLVACLFRYGELRCF
jgi:hypothetical protein